MTYDLHMWLTFAIIGGALVLFVTEKVTMEATSLLIMIALLLLFTLFPLTDDSGRALLTASDLLAGFGNPALITIMALLVMAQGLFQSGALERLIAHASRQAARNPQRAAILILLLALLSSGLMNNTPVVLITIPLLAAVIKRGQLIGGPYMLGLSFMSIFGGMLTLMGSSTNLLVAETARLAGTYELKFFDQTLPGLVLAAIGLLYVLFIMPRLLQHRKDTDNQTSDESGRQYIIELRLRAGDTLVGAKTQAGFLPALPGMTLQMIERDGRAILPPFDDTQLRVGDKLFIAATRREILDALTDRNHPLREQILSHIPDSENIKANALVTAELVVAPGSRMAARSIYQTGFSHSTDCFIIGVQRQSRMARHQMPQIRLEAGDVLLVIGEQSGIEALRHNRDALLMEWSARELPSFEMAGRARAIFAATVIAAASGIVPIVVAALIGATAMVLGGVLNVRQAGRGFNLRIFLLVAAALAMANALYETGGTMYLVNNFLALFAGASPAIVLSGFFLLCAIITNVLSNNATAVLFTPLAVGLANSLNVDPLGFLLAVIFAANCSFVTPIAYQTNLLVMAPGNLQFRDFVRAGLPLAVLIWISFSLFAPWYFGF